MDTFDFTLAKARLLARHRGAGAEGTPEPARAAVAAVLRNGMGGSELLFIARAEHEGDPWSGHVAFPGGKREACDESLLATAIRETEEEVGLRLTADTCLARLTDVVASTRGLRVAEFVFALEEPDVALTMSREVAACFWVPVARLTGSEGAGTVRWMRGGVEVELPCLHLGAHILWGMTHRMVRQLIAALRENG